MRKQKAGELTDGDEKAGEESGGNEFDDRFLSFRFAASNEALIDSRRSCTVLAVDGGVGVRFHMHVLRHRLLHRLHIDVVSTPDCVVLRAAALLRHCSAHCNNVLGLPADSR